MSWNCSGEIFQDDVITPDGEDVVVSTNLAPSRYSLQVAGGGSFSMSSRDTSGALSSNTWDLRNGNTSSSTTVTYSTWANFVGNWFAFDSTGVVGWDTEESVTIGLGLANATFVIDTDSVFSAEGNNYIKLKDLSASSGTPNTSGFASIRNNDKLNISGVFDTDARGVNALATVKTALAGQTSFTSDFTHDTDTEYAAFTGWVQWEWTSYSGSNSTATTGSWNVDFGTPYNGVFTSRPPHISNCKFSFYIQQISEG